MKYLILDMESVRERRRSRIKRYVRSGSIEGIEKKEKEKDKRKRRRKRKEGQRQEKEKEKKGVGKEEKEKEKRKRRRIRGNKRGRAVDTRVGGR